MEVESSSPRSQEHTHRCFVMWPTIDNKICTPLLKLFLKRGRQLCKNSYKVRSKGCVRRVYKFNGVILHNEAADNYVAHFITTASTFASLKHFSDIQITWHVENGRRWFPGVQRNLSCFRHSKYSFVLACNIPFMEFYVDLWTYTEMNQVETCVRTARLG
jgi:hypothetical protein